MGSKKKKGKEGAFANYVTRTRALKKLQVSLKDFRRLCILKGIYPRPPKKRLQKKYGNKATFYHVKDVLFLAHEPILKKFRETKIYVRKLNKAKNRGDDFRYKRLKQNKPRFSFDHLVKERYPSFLDAIKDLDDGLSMVHLFASLPSGSNKQLTGKRILRCQKLRNEFQAWVVKAGCLRKAFISIKGTYLEVNIHGEAVRFVLPHKFVHKTPQGVDYNVMSTFLDFHETLLKFINFRLYKEVGLSYPPLLDEKLDSLGLGFTAIKLETVEQANHRIELEQGQEKKQEVQSKNIENLNEILESVPKEADDKDSEMEETEEVEEKIGEEFEALEEKNDSRILMCKEDRGDLFNGLCFLLNRETPQDNLEFIILACGGECSRFQFADVKDNKFTHQIIDRPVKEDSLLSTREYIQPQWIVDCLNVGKLIPTRPYRPGVVPPPHLSPFVNNEKAGYTPKQAAVVEAWATGKPVPAETVEKEDAEMEEKEQDSEEEMSDNEKEDPAKRQMQETLLTGKRRKLLKAMKMGQKKKDAFVTKLEEKRRKLDTQESDSTNI